MNSPFNIAVEFVLSHEGVISNDPRDPGKLTKYGISQRRFPRLAIASLSRDDAIQIYYKHYWKRPRLKRFSFPTPVSLAVFDAGVNCSPRKAIQFLQAAFNKMPLGGHLVADGVLGPLTHRAINLWCEAQPFRTVSLVQAMSGQRIRYYNRLARLENFRAFLRGWINRSLATSDYALQTAGEQIRLAA